MTMIGTFTRDGEASFPENGEAGLCAFEQLIGRRLAQVLWFITFDDEFPTAACEVAIAHGSIAQVTWELFWPSANPNNADTSSPALDDLLAHKHDAYIDSFARDAAAFGKPVLIRFLHEFNGNWYIWGGFKNGAAAGGPEKVKAVWRYVVDRFRAVGATNVKWLWCPHGPTVDVPTDAWNDVENYYPGDDYVDWFGMDGYNWYPKDPWGGVRPYQDFDTAFRPLYDRLVAMASKPISISEMGSGEFTYGQINKADWIAETFTRMKSHPAIRLFSWFNVNKELDWRVNSSPAALAAFRSMMSDPFFESDYTDPGVAR
jgi:beta-mannanase